MPEVVVGISRGGLFPARVICDFFRLKDLLCLKMEHWGVTATITGKAEIKYGIDDNAKRVLRDKRVIIADDITDTGESLRIAAEYVRSLGAEEVKTATMHHKSVSSFVPDFYGERMDEWVWVIYPWSLYEDISHLILNIPHSAISHISHIAPHIAPHISHKRKKGEEGEEEAKGLVMSVDEIKEALKRAYDLEISHEDLRDVIENMAFLGEIELIGDSVVLRTDKREK